VQVIAVPTVPLAEQATVTPNGRGAIVIVADAVAVIVFASVAVTETVLLPLTLYDTVKLAPVPDAGLPPVAVHANV
jgi:hypothetical protein